MKTWQEIYETELINNPPKPPWIMYPDVDPLDMFWRMGKGESHIINLGIYFHFCGADKLKEYASLYPEPEEWKGWYEDDI